jgi:signal transduction histidine kinase/CheY-like chemotaxis protein/CBS domain-containing protein
MAGMMEEDLSHVSVQAPSPDLRVYPEVPDDLPRRSPANGFPEGNFIGSAVQAVPPLAPEEGVQVALERFQDRGLTALPVVEEGEIPVGILHKTKLLSMLGQKYGFALFGTKPVRTVMESPLVFDYNTPLEEVSLKVVARDENSIYDAIIVVKGGSYAGTVQVYQILSRLTEQNLQRMQEEASSSAALLQLETRLRLTQGAQEVCEAAMGLVPQLFPGTCVRVWRWDSDRATLRPGPCGTPAVHVREGDLNKALRTRQTLVLADTAGGLLGDGEVRYFLLVPMVVGSALLGVMCVCRGNGDAVSDADVELSEELAGQVALALHGEQSREDLEKQLKHISLLNQITRSVIERLDLDSLFRVVFQQVEDLMPVDFTGVALYNPDEDVLKVLSGGPRSHLLAAEIGMSEGTLIPLDQTDLRDSLKGETVYRPDLTEVHSPVARRLVGKGLRSAVVVPLIDDHRVFGIMLACRREADGFSRGEIDFLKALGEHVALAEHHARLYNDLQNAYNQLRETQQAMMRQERLRALGQMASGIAHDINNMLSPVVGFSDLLLAAEPDLSDRTRHYLGIIKTAGEDIARIVARMRGFYRKRSEQEALNPISLNRMVEQAVELTRPRWRDMPQERGVVFRVWPDLQEDLPLVMGIETEVREAITNLILNAVDAMPLGGSILLRTRMKGDSITLEICDQGVGMDEETRLRCLEPFFSTKGEHGTGLGLAMVFGVMRRHEGEIQIDSQPGKGTTVRLKFPVPPPDASRADTSPSVTPPSPGPRRILFVDDEPNVRALVYEMLTTAGHSVEVAESGQAGQEAFRAAKGEGRPYDAVITDLGMPYVDGRDVARTVKTESPNTPVVLLTGWGSRMNAEGGVPPEVDCVVEKPVKLHELQEALWRVTCAVK